MTESAWATSTDPARMLESLRGKISDRKFRLFAVTCCRRIFHLLEDRRSRRALEVGEQHAEGLLNHEDWLAINREASLSATDIGRAAEDALINGSDNVQVSSVYAAAAAGHLLGEPAFSRAESVATCTENALASLPASRLSVHNFENDIRLKERAMHCGLLREIFGNPFQPLVLDPSWLKWNGGTVITLAQGIYEDRAFDRLPILADALMDAGCFDEEILNHCRSQGPHVRGCWVVDLVLGKR